MSASAFAELATAYEGLELLDKFPDAAALQRYRQGVLERSTEQARFLIEQGGSPARVLEVGSGNGRLLIELARQGALEHGLGIELSSSRTDFARHWIAEEGLESRIDLRAGNVLDTDLEAGAWDVAACITGTFAYFDAVDPGSARRLLAALHRALRPDGTLVLELYPHPNERRLLQAADGRLNTWRELGDDDPWRFYLSELALDGDVLTHRKTFVHRTSGAIDEGRSERLVLYTADTLRPLLTDAGFAGVEVREGWGPEPYAGGDLLVVSAVRAS
jgi:SAM-dependent methyltransferase